MSILTGSVGIIGGADGPTAIFVSGGSGILLPAAAVICGLIALVTILKKRKK